MFLTDDGVASEWSRLLNGREVEPDDDFFVELGGDSLLAIVLVARFSELTDLPLELHALYEAPTPREFASYMVTLRERLDALREVATEEDGWSLAVVGAALIEFGAYAAERFLPSGVGIADDFRLTQHEAVVYDRDSRAAILRQVRGLGRCQWTDETKFTAIVQRTGATLYLRVSDESSGSVIHISGAPYSD